MTDNDNLQFKPQYVGYGNGEGMGSMYAILLSRLFDRKGDDCDGGKLLNALTNESVCDLRKETVENRADIIENLREVQSDLKGKICDAEKSAVEARWDAKLSVAEAKNDINHKICEVGHTLRDVKCEIENKIERNTAAVLKQLHDDKIDEKNEEIDRLRHRNLYHEQNAIFASQFSNINAILSHLVMQEQKQSSKVVQFGAGNSAIPVNTNNAVG